MSRTYNSQFLLIDFRLLDDPRYCAFMRSPAFPVYMLLRRYVWRSAARPHPFRQVNELYRDGFLAAAVPREVLGEKLGVRGLPSISRHIAELEALGVIRKVKTGRQNVYVLGTWEDRSAAGDGRYVEETFFLDQLFGPEPFAPPAMSDVAPGLSSEPPAGARSPEWDSEEAWRRAAAEMGIGDADGSAEVSLRRPSEVSKTLPMNREGNREENTRRQIPEASR